MEILKDGTPIELDRYYFVCSVCGCEFIADTSEITISTRVARCPNCFTKCNGTLLEENEGEE